MRPRPSLASISRFGVSTIHDEDDDVCCLVLLSVDEVFQRCDRHGRVDKITQDVCVSMEIYATNPHTKIGREYDSDVLARLCWKGDDLASHTVI